MVPIQKSCFSSIKLVSLGHNITGNNMSLILRTAFVSNGADLSYRQVSICTYQVKGRNLLKDLRNYWCLSNLVYQASPWCIDVFSWCVPITLSSKLSQTWRWIRCLGELTLLLHLSCLFYNYIGGCEWLPAMVSDGEGNIQQYQLSFHSVIGTHTGLNPCMRVVCNLKRWSPYEESHRHSYGGEIE